MRIIDRETVERRGLPAPDREAWTALIPAAGRGSRLGYNGPKVLFSILGRPLISWVTDLVADTCAQLVFVLAPDERALVEPVLEEKFGGRFRVVEQPAPKGTVDAILAASLAVETPNVALIWGDQVGPSQGTVVACQQAHEGFGGHCLTLPTVVRPNPYIAIQRDECEQMVSVAQARENEINLDQGEADCGMFMFATKHLFTELEAAISDEVVHGSVTGEVNLLSLLPRFERIEDGVLTIRVTDRAETLGVNTREEAECATTILNNRKGGIN